MGWGNIVETATGGIGFVNFDKVVRVPPVFDLAKLIATGMVQLGAGQVQGQDQIERSEPGAPKAASAVTTCTWSYPLLGRNYRARAFTSPSISMLTTSPSGPTSSDR